MVLVHGEEQAITGLSSCLRQQLSAPVHVARSGEMLGLSEAGISMIGRKQSVIDGRVEIESLPVDQMYLR